MRMRIDEAHDLVRRCMARFGYDSTQQVVIADHLIDSTLRGFGQGGLPRAVTLIERLETSRPFGPIVVEQETSSSVAVDGGDQLGYIVAKDLTERLIAKCADAPVVAGTARNTWCTGMFSYYLEMITRAGLIGFIASSGGPTVAPHGGNEGRFGTNPVAFGFPTDDVPVIWDIGTSELMLADLSLAVKTGEDIAPGKAFASDGTGTTDPAAALAGGAIAAWGGHKGSGLAVVAQLLGMAGGSEPAPDWLTDMGLFIFVADPAAFSPDFAARVTSYADWLRSTRPVDPEVPVRVPFERSARARDRAVAEQQIEVPDEIVRRLREFVAGEV